MIVLATIIPRTWRDQLPHPADFRGSALSV